MDLTGWLLARATPRVLPAVARGGAAARLGVERAVRERGWAIALSPADADLLVVCGRPDPELREAIEAVWAQLPSPRARVEIEEAAHAGDELDRARRSLGACREQRVDAAARSSGTPPAADLEHGPPAGAGPATGDAHDMHDMHDTGADPAANDGPHGAGPDMGMDMHMGHGGDVGGLPMAGRAPDRDGLSLDQLHVTLGPIMSDWPAGLRVHLTIQGDVVAAATVGVVGSAPPAGSVWGAGGPAAALDSLTRLLAVCGWPVAARTARRLRDELLAGACDPAELGRFTRRVRRSRTLRWATDGLGVLDDAGAGLAGDATRRCHRLLDVAEGAVAPDAAERARIALGALAALLEGQELAGVRVVVASLDPDLDAVAPVSERGAVR